MKFIKILFILLYAPCVILGQEVISDLYANPHKIKHIKQFGAFEKTNKSAHLFLPFKDDFSGRDIYPNGSLWEDRYAFINNTYPINPITIGVATLDALNDSGLIYIHANPSTFIADHLTTNRIRLDSVYQGPNLVPVKVSDSLYLSFYYQPQGIGNAPESYDSLSLEFFSPADSLWHWAWSTSGKSYQAFYAMHQTSFKRVMIPITDSLMYFHKDFRFRFKNYASIANTYEPSWAGNVDHWHIDYVYMNIGRHINDTIYEDVAFTERPTSLLQNYQSVPWAHYKATPSAFPSASNIELPYVNLSDITKNVNRNFAIYDMYDNSSVFNYSGGNLNLLPLQDEIFNIPVSHSFSSASGDSALFELRGIINTTPDINRRNDTVRFMQRFHNYYAYDDGSPENGYGLSPAGSKLAYRFHLSGADTLKAVKMFFNPTFENASQKNFFLTIWTGQNAPSQIVYQEANIRPEFEDQLNKFHTYFLEEPLVLSGTFYVGWVQTTNDNLNIGFDRNNNVNNHIFYNTDGTWRNSMYEGALMIRPVFGNLFNVGLDDIYNTEPVTFTAYPNPNNGHVINFRVNTNDFVNYDEYAFVLYDIVGKKIIESPLAAHIFLPDNIRNGMYFYTIIRTSDNHIIGKDKLTVIR